MIDEAGYTLLSIDTRCAVRAGRLAGGLPGYGGNPFDRMLAAQSLTEDIPILSRDPKLDAFAIRLIR